MELHREHTHAPEHLPCRFELKRLATQRTEEGSELGVFEGVASTFGQPDLIGDVIERGAFRASLDRGHSIKMLWQHDPRTPIGVWDRVSETPAGLAVKGRLVLAVQQARETLALLRAGAVDALSIGFSVPKGGAVVDRETSLRRLTTIDLWEISVVTFPANARARIHRVKTRAAGGRLPSEREFERLLTRDAGFSRSQARVILGAGYKSLMATQDAGHDADQAAMGDLAARLRRVAALVAKGAAGPDAAER